MTRLNNNNLASPQLELERGEVPEQVFKNIESIAKLQVQDEETKTLHFKLLDRVVAFSSRPAFLYLLLSFFLLWWLGSELHHSGIIKWNLPDYRLQEQFLDTISFVISTAILIRQTHQEKTAEHQSHLMLQLDILSEQKIAKIIDLLEELRSDLPDVIDRVDPEAENMKRSTDPEKVINIIKENLIATEPALEAVVPSTPSDDSSQSST